MQNLTDSNKELCVLLGKDNPTIIEMDIQYIVFDLLQICSSIRKVGLTCHNTTVPHVQKHYTKVMRVVMI